MDAIPQVSTRPVNATGVPRQIDLLRQVERYIQAKLYTNNLNEGVKDGALKLYLDEFYWRRLPRTKIGKSIDAITVLGGRRKVWAIERICSERSVFLEDIAFVGDGITDAQAIKVIEAVGGLAIAFNGNAFVVPYATVGVASTNLQDLCPILQAWQVGGRTKVYHYVSKHRKSSRKRKV